MDNPYAPPRATVVDAASEMEVACGSIAGALAGEYALDPWALARQAWARVRGHRIRIVGAAVGQLVVSIVGAGLLNRYALSPEAKIMNGDFLGGLLASQATGVILLPLTAPLVAGVGLLGLDVARGHRSGLRPMLWAFRTALPLALTNLVISLCTAIGYALLVVPGVYLATAYAFAPTLVADRGMGVWEALELSRRAVSMRWTEVFLALALAGSIGVAGIFVFGIGLLWSVPTAVVMYGLIYRAIFGDS